MLFEIFKSFLDIQKSFKNFDIFRKFSDIQKKMQVFWLLSSFSSLLSSIILCQKQSSSAVSLLTICNHVVLKVVFSILLGQTVSDIFWPKIRLFLIIKKFSYNERSDWLKQRTLSENKEQVNDIKLAFKFLLRNFDKLDLN